MHILIEFANKDVFVCEIGSDDSARYLSDRLFSSASLGPEGC